ncbi:MAG: hypothetical protein AB1726_12630 [Planctomycetota bacterium]
MAFVARFVSALALVPLLVAPSSAQASPLPAPPPVPRGALRYEPPIRIIIDCHADPFFGGDKPAVYAQWIANANWLIDVLDQHGAYVSWGEVGEFGEFVVEGGTGGPGAALLRRAYQSGGAIFPHSHSEYRAGVHQWPDVPQPSDPAWVQRNWDDVIGWTEQAILVALTPLPEPLGEIRCVRGAHLPGDEYQFHALMASTAIPYREAGPDESFYAYFEHYVYHPYRPSPANVLDESLSTPFVQLTHGPVIGLAGIHNGVFQDYTLEAAKAQFLLEFVNWRHRWRTGAPDHEWCFGGGGHPSNYNPGDAPRLALPPLLTWLDTWFVGQAMPDGTRIAEYSSERRVGEAFLAWEAAHPGESSFRYPATAQDYDWYPWLRPAHEELHGSRHVADLAAPSGVRAFRLQSASLATIVLAWSDAGWTALDLSAIFGAGMVTRRGLESGSSALAASSAVPIGGEPVVVRL